MGGQETFKAAVWYNGKIVNQDGNNPRYVGGTVKYVDVDPNTTVEVFLATVRDIFGIPGAAPITVKYHIFISMELSKLLDVSAPYESLKLMLQPGLMLHPFYVEKNVAEDGTDTKSNEPKCRRSARISKAIQPPPDGVEILVKPSARVHADGSVNHDQKPVLNPIRTRQSNKRSVADRDDSVDAVIVGDHVGRTTTSTNSSSQMRIILKSLCGLEKPLYVKRTETVRSLKEQIEIIEGTAVEDQRLIYGGRHLGDDRTFEELGITDGSVIDIVQCLTGC